MHALRILTLVATLTTSVIGQDDVLPIRQSPLCTQQCTKKYLDPAGCQLENLRECFCTSTELEKNVALCVMQTCNASEQAATYTFFQNNICKGIPQPSRSNRIIRDIIIIAAVTFPVVVLRFISRSMVANRIGWDDWAVGLGAIIMIPMTVIPILNATRGFGRHFWDVPPENIPSLRKLYFVSQILYIVLQALAKLSILFLYLRIFTNKRFRLATSLTMTGIALQTAVFTTVVTFQCRPINSYWDVTVEGKCIDSLGFVYSAAGVSIFEDFLIMFLPLWELKSLKLDIRKKSALGFIFALGSFACITSMIRLKYVITYGDSIDLTYDNVDVIIWSVLETFTAIICTSLMCFRPLLVKLIPSLFRTTRNGSKHTPTPTQGHAMGLKLGIKSRPGNNRIELSSVDEASSGGKPEEIRV